VTDEDGALAEFQDLEHLADWLVEDVEEEPKIVPPTGENLIDDESREKLPPLYSGERKDWILWPKSSFSLLQDRGLGTSPNSMERMCFLVW